MGRLVSSVMTVSPSAKWIQLLVLPVLFYVGVRLSLALAVMPEVLVMMWLPNALLLAALLHYGFRRYAYLVALIVAAEIAADYPTFSLVEAIAFALVNLAEVTIAYSLLRRWAFDPRFAAPGDLTKFVMAAPVIAAFVAACGGAAVYSYFRGEHTSYLDFQQVWWFSDGLGLLILTPLVLSFWPPLPVAADRRTEWHWYDSLALAGAVTIVAAFLAADRGMINGVSLRPVLLLPLAVYVAARFSLRSTTLALVGLAAVVLYVTKNGQQPFGDLPIRETVVLVQEFIIIMSILALGLAALLAQARATTRELEDRVRDRTAALSEANAQLEKLAVTDPLTNVLNRRALFALLQREIERAQRQRRELAIIMLDVDHFKPINDRYGHAAGDLVLRHVVAKTTEVIRGTDTMARYGGEEFVLVAPETDITQAVQLAERMRQSLNTSDVTVSHDVVRVTASLGVAVLRADDDQPEQILRRADEALYAAKTAGRDRVAAETPLQAHNH